MIPVPFVLQAVYSFSILRGKIFFNILPNIKEFFLSVLFNYISCFANGHLSYDHINTIQLHTTLTYYKK